MGNASYSPPSTIPDGSVTNVKVAADAEIDNTKIASLGNAATMDIGTTAGTVAAGDDSRLSNDRTADSVRETSGPTVLTLGAVADGEFLKRVGNTVVGAAAGGGGAPSAHADSHTISGSDPIYGPSLIDVALAEALTVNFVLGETIPRYAASTTVTISNGGGQISFFRAPETRTISQIGFKAASNTTSGLTLLQFGLYTVTSLSNVDNGSNLPLVARTVNLPSISTSSMWFASLDNTEGYPATYQLVQGNVYGILITAAFTGGTFSSIAAGVGVDRIRPWMGIRSLGTSAGPPALLNASQVQSPTPIFFYR